MPTPRHGIQTTVSLNGGVVDQWVMWAPRKATGWLLAAAPVTDEDGAPEIRWGENGRSTLRGVELVGPGRWVWSNHNGLKIDFQDIEMKHAPRGMGVPFGDVSLLVMMLALVVGMGQLNYLFQSLVGARPTSSQSVEPSPELIARLLKKQFDGAEQGTVARTQRPEAVRVSPSFYLPAGSPGPLTKAGGGEKASETPVRQAPDSNLDNPVDAAKDVLTSTPLGHTKPLSDDGLQVEGIEGLVVAAVEEEEQADKTLRAPSIERFIGWGFHDWLDVAEADSMANREMSERLELSRQLMKIDPDEPYAILTVAYYAYLSENYELCRSLYARYIELYPDDAAGWNNLALTFKRSGEYAEEERLYRMALSLEPQNSNTRNNLAVNLAHQGRFGEAEALMDSFQPAPDEAPYAELHRAKIAAARGRLRKAQKHLKKAVADAGQMDTFHHIEFRQDIRLDPSFAELRQRSAVKSILEKAYGDDSPLKLGQKRGREPGATNG